MQTFSQKQLWEKEREKELSRIREEVSNLYSKRDILKTQEKKLNSDLSLLEEEFLNLPRKKSLVRNGKEKDGIELAIFIRNREIGKISEEIEETEFSIMEAEQELDDCTSYSFEDALMNYKFDVERDERWNK